MKPEHFRKHATQTEVNQIMHLLETHTTKEIAAKLQRSRHFVSYVMKREGFHVGFRYTINRMMVETGYSADTLRAAVIRLGHGRVTPGGVRILTENERDGVLRELQTWSPHEEASRARVGKPHPIAAGWFAEQPNRAGSKPGTRRGRQVIQANRTQRSQFQVEYLCDCGYQAWTGWYRFQHWQTDRCKQCPRPGQGFTGVPAWAKKRAERAAQVMA